MLHPTPALTPTLAAQLAETALASIAREYPNQIAHAMASDADAGTPRQLHPAFYGCYDWHSAVHSHWCLARLLRTPAGARDTAREGTQPGAGAFSPRAVWQTQATSLLNQHLTPDNLGTEAAYLAARPAYERPYGLAWLLQLDAELLDHPTPDAAGWHTALQPLAHRAADDLTTWFANLTHPVRTGVHSQSAFAMGLALDWARATGHTAAAEAITEHALRLHASDPAWSFAFEPSGEDFLSPSLAAADLMRRVLPQAEFARWLGRALPELATAGHSTLAPVASRDHADGRLAHLDGLCLSRAWMLEAIAAALRPDAPHRPALEALAATHLRAGLAALASGDYNRTHWLASFAAYALTAPAAQPRP